MVHIERIELPNASVMQSSNDHEDVCAMVQIFLAIIAVHWHAYGTGSPANLGRMMDDDPENMADDVHLRLLSADPERELLTWAAEKLGLSLPDKTCDRIRHRFAA